MIENRGIFPEGTIFGGGPGVPVKDSPPGKLEACLGVRSGVPEAPEVGIPCLPNSKIENIGGSHSHGVPFF